MRGGSVASGLRVASKFGVFAFSLISAGCVSYTYVDSHQVQHVVGFVDVAMAPPAGKSSATAVILRSFGLSFFRHPTAGSDISLGYSEQSVVSLPDNACLDLQAKGVCADLEAHALTQ